MSDFKKKTVRVRNSLEKKYDFRSRCYKEADKNVVSGDYSRAMQSLLKIDSKVNLGAIENTIKDSLPPRNYAELSQNQRQTLFTHAHSSNDQCLLTVNDVLQQLKTSKKNRSPGVDGMTIEHLNSIFLGGNTDDAYKREILDNYVQFLNKCLKSELTDNQKKILHSLKLAAVPKTDEESRVIMMLGLHSKIIFSSFAGSKLKKKLQSEHLKHQYGTKSAGAEAVVHTFQQVISQNPDYDVFSADAVKAFYNLNRDITMRKLKDVAPQVFNFFMDKYDNSANAFFFGLARGVATFKQTEGGAPGSPEMSFLYELGISDFVQNIADLLSDPNSSQPRKGVVAGYMDDLCWAAPFAKMVDVINFVKARGPAYGYNLNMKKSIYLMAPSSECFSQQQLFERINVLASLGMPIENIKAHPRLINSCHPSTSSEVLAKRAVQWGCKILGAFVGMDEYVIHQLNMYM